jgi:hypothetical protein
MAKSRSKAKAQKFSFEIDKKRLIEFSKMTIAARLNWLEEANRFINSVSGGSIRKRWELIRSGKV